jgi:hypothetical protein
LQHNRLGLNLKELVASALRLLHAVSPNLKLEIFVDGFPQVASVIFHFRRGITAQALLALMGLVFAAVPSHAATSVDTTPLDAGYRQMYNLDFETAHQTFSAWELAHPEDPLGPVSNAAAYLFAEFDRMHILESELFVDDASFEKRKKFVPDPKVRAAFESELSRGEYSAQQILARSPDDHAALFARVLVGGLRSDYLALVEKRNLAALSTIKSSRALAEKLLARDPSYYDAYLAIGVENYLLSVNPAPVRWLLRLGGARTDKQEGLAKLRLTAEKGHYLAPYARVLLAVAALRDHDRNQARTLLSNLAQEFPNNPLYRRELARIDR